MTNNRGNVRAIVLLSALLVAPAVAPADPVDHATWDQILKTYVTADGWIDYTGIRTKGKRQMRTYLTQLAKADPSSLGSREDQMAFWINAYNAVTIQTLIDEDLPGTVPHAPVFGKNIFKQTTFKVAGGIRSLDEIEHKILRPRFDEPRVHAALVCGASSCPRLRPEAYTGADLETQLNEEAVRWVQAGLDLNGQRKNRLDRAAGTYFASAIFRWFEEDFGGNRDGVLRFIAKFSSDDDRAFIEANTVRLKYLDYDWSINSQ